MRGFRFRLDAVLHVREHELERRRVTLGEVLTLEARARRRSDADTASLVEAERTFSARIERGSSGGEVASAARAVLRLAARSNARQGEVATLEAKVSASREAVRGAHARVRGLEILRMRALTAHRNELERRERIELDEAGLLMHAARRRTRWAG